MPFGSKTKHNVVQLNPNENKCFILTPYPTSMQTLNNFPPENLSITTRNSNIDLQFIGKYFNSDMQHHIRTQQFQPITTDYSGYFKDIKGYIYLIVDKNPPQIFHLKSMLLVFYTSKTYSQHL